MWKRYSTFDIDLRNDIYLRFKKYWVCVKGTFITGKV